MKACLFILLTWLALTGGCQAAERVNVLSDGGLGNISPGKPGTARKIRTYTIADGTYNRKLFRRVADDDTPTGFAVIANPRFNKQPGYLAVNLYLRDIPPGRYRVVYRIKVARATGQRGRPLLWDINSDSPGFQSSGTIDSGEFGNPGDYEEHTAHFVVPPGVQWIEPRLFWQGGYTTWIDTISIIEEK